MCIAQSHVTAARGHVTTTSHAYGPIECAALRRWPMRGREPVTWIILWNWLVRPTETLAPCQHSDVRNRKSGNYLISCQSTSVIACYCSCFRVLMYYLFFDTWNYLPVYNMNNQNQPLTRMYFITTNCVLTVYNIDPCSTHLNWRKIGNLNCFYS